MDLKQNQRNIALTLIKRIEDITGKMFHEVYPDLADTHAKCMDIDSGFPYLINQLNKIIDQLNQ